MGLRISCRGGIPTHLAQFHVLLHNHLLHHCISRVVWHGSAGNVRNVWKLLEAWADNEADRNKVQLALRLCPAAKLDSKAAVNDLAEWLQAAFDSLVGSPAPLPPNPPIGLVLTCVSCRETSYVCYLGKPLHKLQVVYHSGDMVDHIYMYGTCVILNA